MSVIEKLDSVLALMLADKGLITIGDYLVTGDFLRDHGPAIRQDMIDARRYRWLRNDSGNDGDHPYAACDYGPHKDDWLTGAHLDAAIDAAIDARLASDSEGGSDERLV